MHLLKRELKGGDPVNVKTNVKAGDGENIVWGT
jgi:hypothetical protein